MNQNFRQENVNSEPIIRNQHQSTTGGTTVVVNQTETHSNGVGTAGFVLALLSVIFSWVPILNWIFWILGLILSFIGVFKRPKGLAIAGLCLSLLGIIIIIAVIGTIGALISTL